jgi:murein DD-endopeptidase MepM/ murein hydrolase activator NlpD
MARGGRILAAFALFLALAAPSAGASGWAQLGFVWPAQGTITTPFTLHVHDGIDIGMLRTLTVRAAAAGTVELVGQPYGYAGYGNVVVVRVNPDVITIYAHLASSSVKVGDSVLPNQPIAIAGCTGICTGTHLHFEVRVDGTPVNPMQFLS